MVLGVGGFVLLLIPPLATGAPPAIASPAPSFALTGAPSFALSSEFWGVNERVYSPISPALASAYDRTPLGVVRWPGGAVADALNVSANWIYHDDGTHFVPPSDAPGFARWCSSVHCRAIIELPGEIDDPSTAAAEVRYLEQGLGLAPAYFEIGNEPAQWTHFGRPWASWSTTDHLNVSPSSYASVVHSYLAAIHRVDPTARVLGLPGVGNGAKGELAWIRATVALNGPELAGVAIHVYPAGAGPAQGASLAGFYQSLSGPGSLTSRVPADRAAIQAACAHCPPLPLLVTELGEGNGGGSYAPLMSGFYNVAFVAAELAEAATLNLTSVELFALQATYPGSLFDPTLAPGTIGRFYSTFLPGLGERVLPIATVGLASGVHLLLTYGSSTGRWTLLAANTDPNRSQQLTLLGTGFPLVRGSVMSWNVSDPGPVAWGLPGPLPGQYLLPPGGILWIEGNLSKLPDPASAGPGVTGPSGMESSPGAGPRS